MKVLFIYIIYRRCYFSRIKCYLAYVLYSLSCICFHFIIINLGENRQLKEPPHAAVPLQDSMTESLGETNESESCYSETVDGQSTGDDLLSTDVQSNDTSTHKYNAFGELKTGRYTIREKPPLPPRRKYRKRKGSTKATRFSKRISKQKKRKVDQVYIHYIY